MTSNKLGPVLGHGGLVESDICSAKGGGGIEPNQRMRKAKGQITTGA